MSQQYVVRDSDSSVPVAAPPFPLGVTTADLAAMEARLIDKLDRLERRLTGTLRLY